MTPEVGTQLVNPNAETTTVFTATSTSTDGAYVEIETTYPPHSAKPPLHLHPAQEEHFTVLAGDVHVLRGDEQLTVHEGDTFVVPAGTPHQLWAGEAGVTLRWRTSPALRTGEMFCALWEAARDNDWAPSPLQLFEVVTTYDEEFRLA